MVGRKDAESAPDVHWGALIVWITQHRCSIFQEYFSSPCRKAAATSMVTTSRRAITTGMERTP